MRGGFRLAPAAVCTDLSARLRSEVLAKAPARETGLVQWLLGVLAPGFGWQSQQVRSPRHRRHVALDLSPLVAQTLRSALGGLRDQGAVAEAGLDAEAELVELSAMIVDPGAAAQDAHTDVPAVSPTKICTLWCALQDVDETMGPVAVYGEDVAEAVERIDWVALAREADNIGRAVLGTCDGDVDATDLALDPSAGSPPSQQQLLRDALARAVPVVVAMSAGDAMLMDCRAHHFGTANTSTRSRVQLSATFRQPGRHRPPEAKGARGAPGAGDESGAELGLDLAQQLTGDAGEGFTYELRPELAGKHKLGDFVT